MLAKMLVNQDGEIQNSTCTPCHIYHKGPVYSIANDLSKISVPEDIRRVANDIYRSLNLCTKRGNQRKKMIFYCIIMAYEKLGILCDPKDIADKVGISYSDINKAMDIVITNNFKHYNPLDFIPIYHNKLGLPDNILNDIIDTGKRIIENNKELNDGYPQVIAAVIIMYYLTINGFKINMDAFTKLTNRSASTLKKIYNEVLNS